MGGYFWIGIAENRDKWRALVNAPAGAFTICWFHNMLGSS
jgi:hypothetical protein